MGSVAARKKRTIEQSLSDVDDVKIERKTFGGTFLE